METVRGEYYTRRILVLAPDSPQLLVCLTQRLASHGRQGTRDTENLVDGGQEQNECSGQAALLSQRRVQVK